MKEYNGTDEFLAAVNAGIKIFSGDIIRGVKFLPDKTIFDSIDFTQTEFIGCSFVGCEFEHCNFFYASLHGSHMTDCNFHSCGMAGLTINGGCWLRCEFRNTNLFNTEFRNHTSNKCLYVGCVLNEAQAVNSAWVSCTIKQPTGIRAKTALPGLVHDVITSAKWDIAFSDEHIQIGCQLCRINDWFKFDDEIIASMDYHALDWWREWKPILQALTTAILRKQEKNND